MLRLTVTRLAELIIPEIVRRDSTDIGKIVTDPKGPQRGAAADYFYDMGHLSWALSAFCPQMKVYWSIDELFGTPMASPIPYRLDDLGLSRVDRTVIAQPESWALKFSEYLDGKSNPRTRLYPFLVNVAPTQYVWPTSYDSPAFVRNFGRILRFRKDVREVAASALFSLRKRLDESRGGRGEEDTDSTPGFVGVHLLGQEGFADTNFAPYEETAAHILRYMVQLKYSWAYLAPSATAEHVTSFTERALGANITVITKSDLLDQSKLGYLSGLTWDQQTLIDHELLVRAGRMVGVSDSSFAWDIAMRRAAAGGRVGSQAASSQDGQVRWQDARSTIVGQPGDYENMETATWP